MVQSKQERINNLAINVDSLKFALYYQLKMVGDSLTDYKGQELVDKFTPIYEKMIMDPNGIENSDFARFIRLITSFKPALSQVLKPGREFDLLCDTALQTFNTPLNRIRKQLNDTGKEIKKRGLILPGSSPQMELKYFCSVCKEFFEIPPPMKEKLLNSEAKLDLPLHCNQEMSVKIAKIEKREPNEEITFEKITIPPAEVIMGHQDSKDAHAEYLTLLSVGIDIGSSTSHLVFSRITLKREVSFFNMTNRFIPVDRELIYEGRIIFTPLIDKKTIDIDAIVSFCQEEYQRAGISPDMVDTGAVIVTGETAKKVNAAEIADRLSSESGKFVSATAGPNFESMLGIMGSGIVKQSQIRQKIIMNVDIGGGTSNIAIASKGDILSCSCINVGGRLLGIDEHFKIWRIDEPSELVMKELNMNYQIGVIIPERDVKIIAQTYAQALIEVMLGKASSKVAKMLMMTEDIDLSTPVQEYSFSGGVGEFIYAKDQSMKNYDDIGHYIAKALQNLMHEKKLTLVEPDNKIRATVIGAGSFSLSVSGSTCFVSDQIQLPINNIPILSVNLTMETLSIETVKAQIRKAFNKFDMIEGRDIVGLYFKEFFLPKSHILDIFAKAFDQALPNSVKNQIPVILLFKTDLAKLLGLKISRETAIQKNLICLDELTLESGDFIDIGAPIKSTQVYPVTIKSLVFNQSQN